METYRMLMEMNRKEVLGETITDVEYEEAAALFLKGTCARSDILKYKKCMGVSPETDHLYPDYYIPPYNGSRKLRLIQGYLPKTNLLYANHYELEIIRFLCKAAPENEKVKEMISHTLQRLRHTCFGNFCAQGECLAAGISVLRLLAVAQPDDSEWIDKLWNPLGAIFLSFENRKASVQKGIPVTYFLMVLTDIDHEKARALLSQKKEWLSYLLVRGKRMTGRLTGNQDSEGDTFRIMEESIIRNTIGILPDGQEILGQGMALS